MTTDKLRVAERQSFIEKFDQRLQEHLKSSQHGGSTQRFEEDQGRLQQLQMLNEQLQKNNHELQKELYQSRQDCEYYKLQYEVVKEQLHETSRIPHTDTKKLELLLEVKQSEIRNLQIQLDRQPQKEIEMLRSEVKELNESMERMGLTSRMEQESILRSEIQQLRRKIEMQDRGRQNDAHLVQKIKLLETENAILNNKLSSCREQLSDLMQTHGNYDSQPLGKTPNGKASNSMKEFFTLNDREADESNFDSSKEDLIDELKSQNGMLRSHLQETNKRFEQQIQKFNDYIDKLTKSKTQHDDKGRLKNMFKSMSVYFHDFSRQKSRYEQIIVSLLSQIVKLNAHLKKKPQHDLAVVKLLAQNGFC